MQLKKTFNLHIRIFSEQVIVFDPNTGQTHCLDVNINEMFKQLSCNEPCSDSHLLELFLNDCPEHEKLILNEYLQSMLKNLLDLKLIYMC